ncbi:virulence RhuM family protein [Candidatus Saccharibacteria bacterium]|nr:virulence RhuM family protein [Candidatus Saccharibacteria bacterium]
MSNDLDKSGEFLFYTTPDGELKVEAYFQNETVWLSQKRMAELFSVDRTVIGRHLKNTFASGELEEKSNVQKMHVANSDKLVSYYNLDVIISVGYRVNSPRAIGFRKWATAVLRNYMVKGFALDDERLKHGAHFGKDYFDELLERIREIRASERRFYQKITDIYSTASDYDPNAPITLEFFATVQNKLHWAIHGQTAAELIVKGADSTKPNMGLKTWRNAPRGKILKSDVTVGKNYLDERQVSELNRIVTMYLDYAENQASRGIPMTMADWVKRLDAFLAFNDYDILNSPGEVSKAAAKELAEAEYDKFRPLQDKRFESDFDRAVKKIQNRPRGKSDKA